MRTKKLITAVVILSLAVLVASCGGGGGGGGTQLQPPAYNVAGTWSVTETPVTDGCYTKDWTPMTVTVDVSHQPGSNSLTLTERTSGYVIHAAISGNNITYSISGSEGACDTLSQTVSVSLDSENHGSGTVNWTCSGTTVIINPCSGTETIEFTKQTSGTTAPAAPTSLVATATSSSTIDLTWTDNSNNEAGFKIERSTSSTTGFTQIGIASANVTGYTSSSLNASTTYYYRVRAYNSAGDSGYTNTANDITQSAGATPPAAPSNVSIINITQNSALMSWTDNSNNETGFEIGTCTLLSCSGNLCKCGAGFTPVAQVGANVTAYQLTGLTSSTLYNYAVRAYNSAGSSSDVAKSFKTLGTAVCTPGQTRCVAGNIEAVETCNDSGTGWTQSTCPTWKLCSQSACRTICDIDITSPPLYPTICMVPNADGVNNGEWLMWYDNRLTVPTYVTGQSVVNANVNVHAPVSSSGLTWPFKWRITTDDTVGFLFKLNQFGAYKKPKLSFKAKRAGLASSYNYTNHYAVGIFNGVNDIAYLTLPISGPPYTWETNSCSVGTHYSQLNYTGGWNGMQLSITGDGYLSPIDSLDVNYVYLTIEP